MSDEFDPTHIPTFDSNDLAQAKLNEPYLGGLVIDRFDPSVSFDSKPIWQYHWAVRPVNIKVTGKTGALHGYVEYKLGRNSNFILLTDVLVDIYGATVQDGFPRTFGHSDNEGLLVGWWVQETFSNLKKRLGGAVNPKFVSSKEYPMPVRAATPEEVAIYQAMPVYVPPVSTAADPTLPESAPREYTADEINMLADFYDGKLSAAAVRAANQNGDLTPELRDEVISGRAHRTLVASGVLVQNGDKTFAKTMPAKAG